MRSKTVPSPIVVPSPAKKMKKQGSSPIPLLSLDDMLNKS